MVFKGRTVVLLVCLTIVVSSFLTLLIIDGEGRQTAENPIEENTSDSEEGMVESPSSEETPASDEEAVNHLEKVHEAFHIITNHFVMDIEEEDVIRGAIDGMLESLDDPHSSYMDPQEAEQFNENFQSSFEGIGAEVTLRDGRVTIVSPIHGSPAEEAGLRPNDQILSVDGTDLQGMDINEAVMHIRGEKGSEAELEVVREGQEESMTVTVVRDEVSVETVHQEVYEQDGQTIGKIQLTSFAQDTAERFEEELTRLEEEENIDALLIDVRGNPGGYLDAVNDIGQFVVPEESMITEIVDRDEESITYRSTLEGSKPYPISVLIDEGSASASEILAAALQEAGDYPVVGETSFGKGTVQSAIHMEDESELMITIAKWLTPDGNWIEGEGVQPDEEIPHPEHFRAARISTDPPLEKDMNNDHVQNLQVILEGLGYDPGRTDGFFSAETEQAVEQYQARADIEVTGVVDEETAQHMEETLSEMMMDEEHDVQLQHALQILAEEAE